MTTLAQRFAEALAHANMTPHDVEKRCKGTPKAGSLYDWLSGDSKTPKYENVVKVAHALGVNPTWLATGKGAKFVSKNGGTALNNISTPQPSRNRVPVISLIQAGNMKEIGALPELGESDHWEEYDGKIGKRGWANVVQGDSMYDGTSNSFPEGTIIFVDPDIAPQTGKYVVAKDVQTQAATFKKLTTDGVRWFLTPLNKQYQAIEIDSPDLRVIGVVVGSRLPERRH